MSESEKSPLDRSDMEPGATTPTSSGEAYKDGRHPNAEADDEEKPADGQYLGG